MSDCAPRRRVDTAGNVRSPDYIPPLSPEVRTGAGLTVASYALDNGLTNEQVAELLEALGLDLDDKW